MKRTISLIKETFADFFKDEATWKAAALSYYTVFALPPLLVLLLEVASAIWDPIEVRRSLTGEFQSLMGQDVAGQIETMISTAEQRTSGSGFRLVLGIAGLVFGATGAFVSLQSALNRAWEVKPDPKRGGIKNFITKRFMSLGMVLGIAFLMLVSLALTSAISVAGERFLGGAPEAVGYTINFIVTFAVITFLFAAMFKVLPDAKIEWRDVWVGGVVTAALFVVGKFLIGFYVGQSDPGNAFGAAGALAVLFIWVYYAAAIVLLGAEFTQAWVRQHGRAIEPERGAVRVVEHEEQIDERGRRRVEEKKDTQTPAPVRRGSRPVTSRRNGRDDVDGSPSGDVGDVRAEIEATRERMSQTIAAIDTRMAGVVVRAADQLDVVTAVRSHPWPALVVAIATGAALAGVGAQPIPTDEPGELDELDVPADLTD